MTLQSQGKLSENDYVVDWSPSDMVEIRFKEDDDFLKIKETLTRMGVASIEIKFYINLPIYYTNRDNIILFTLKNYSH